MKSTFLSFIQFTDGNIFSKLVLPKGIDKDLFIDTLSLKYGEQEPLYTDPHFLTDAVAVWGKKWYRTFEKWVKALSIEYDPLYNYDRTEEIKEEHKTEIGSKTDTTTEDGSTTTNTRSAYDSDSYEPHDRAQYNGNGSVKTDTGGTDEGTFERSAHLFGNIGVTTSQQMLQSELDVARWSLYDQMSDIFAEELLLLVY